MPDETKSDLNTADLKQFGIHIDSPLELWGNATTMNMNNLILRNIQESTYFTAKLSEISCIEELIDQIYYKVDHLEPWEKGSRKTSGQRGMCSAVRGVGTGGVVSSAFCCLYKLFTLRPTVSQLKLFLNHRDSPYIRAIGFMFIRYCLPPDTIFKWFKPYLNDTEEIIIDSTHTHPTTIGSMVKGMLIDINWNGTLFPRIPIPTQKKIDEELENFSKSNKSKIDNNRNKDKKSKRNIRERSYSNNSEDDYSSRRNKRSSPVYKT